MARVWNSLRHFASIKAIPNDSFFRRDDVRVSTAILLSAWRPAAPVKSLGSTRAFARPSRASLSITSVETYMFARCLGASKSTGGIHAESMLDGSCRRVDFSTKLASVRAPIVSWMLNGNPLRMCDPEVQCFRTRPSFLNRRELRKSGRRRSKRIAWRSSLIVLSSLFAHRDESMVDYSIDLNPCPAGESLQVLKPRFPAIHSRHVFSIDHVAALDCPKSTHPRFAYRASRVVALRTFFTVNAIPRYEVM